MGLNMDDAVWDVTVFTKNRDRLLKAEVARRFFDLVVDEARGLDLMSLLSKTRLAVAGAC